MKTINKIIFKNIETDSSNFLVGNKSFFAFENYIKNDFELHIHDCFELEVLLSGKAKTQINNKTYSVKSGSFWICKPNDIHLFFDVEEDCIILSIKFEYNFLLTDVFFSIGKQNENIEGSLTQNELDGLISSFNTFIAQFNSIKNKEKEKMIFSRNYINYLFTYLGILHNNTNTDNNNADKKLFLEVYPYILKNFTNKLTVKEISEKYSYNPDYFSFKFKQTFGINFVEFVNINRLKLAYFLLYTNDYSISEVAKMVGFESISYFYKKFKEMYGKTPKDIVRYKK